LRSNFEAGPSSTKGELASIKKAAVVLGVAPLDHADKNGLARAFSSG
jgi:hypothetical protein